MPSPELESYFSPSERKDLEDDINEMWIDICDFAIEKSSGQPANKALIFARLMSALSQYVYKLALADGLEKGEVLAEDVEAFNGVLDAYLARELRPD